MSERSNSKWIALALALAAGGCDNDARATGVEKPPAPVLQPLLDAYAAPTAALDAEQLATLGASILERAAAADALGIDQRVLQAAIAGLAELAPAAAPPPVLADMQALRVQGDGYLVVTRICDGWGEWPVADFANGFMQLTAGFSEQGLDPVIWGTLSVCRYRTGVRLIQLDGLEPDPRLGDVRAHIGRDAMLEGYGTFPDPILVDLNAQVLVDGVELPGRFSFRISPLDRRLEVLLLLPAGHVIAELSPERTGAVLVRALNGTFACDLTAMRCSAANGETVGAP